jgi:hypothetical protein
MFFGGQSPFAGFSNMNRANSAQYVFRNGNVEYKVFNSFPGGRSQSTTYRFSNSNANEEHEEEEDEEEEDDEEDLITQILRRQLNQQRQQQSQGNTHRHSHTCNHSGHPQQGRAKTSQPNNNQGQAKSSQSFRRINLEPKHDSSVCIQILQFIPILFLIFLVLYPHFQTRR